MLQQLSCDDIIKLSLSNQYKYTVYKTKRLLVSSFFVHVFVYVCGLLDEGREHKMSSFNTIFQRGQTFWVGKFRAKHKRIAVSGCVMQLLKIAGQKK